MDSISLSAVTDVREVHPSNMCEGIFVTEAGNDTLVRDVQPLSTPVMVSAKATSFGNSMLVRAVAPPEGARARNHFEGGGEIDLRKAAAAIDHRVGANLLDALIEIEPFERAGVLQRATEVLDGARDMELLDLYELPEIPSAHVFERVGKRQLLNVLGHDTRREIKFGDFVGLAIMLDGAGHTHRGHAVVGNNTCDFRRALIRGLARIGHAVLGDLKIIRSIRSPRCRGRICDTGRRADG